MVSKREISVYWESVGEKDGVSKKLQRISFLEQLPSDFPNPCYTGGISRKI
jgi:hypothetical protein